MKSTRCPAGAAALAALLAAGPSMAGGFSPAGATPEAMPPAAAPADWSGFYAGGLLGFGRSVTVVDDRPCWWACEVPDTEGSGAQLGLTAGFNAQRGRLVYGIEADIATAPGAERATADEEDDVVTISTDRNLVGTLRGRAGLAMRDTLVFATAGAAFGSYGHGATAGFEDNLDYAQVEGFGTSLVLGAGLEHRITDALSIKAEYLHLAWPDDYGCWRDGAPDAPCFDGGDGSTGVDFRNDLGSFRIGVNYHF